MPIDFYAPALSSPSGVMPSKVVITLDCTQPGVCPVWQSEVGGILDEVSKCMLTDKRIPKVIRDAKGRAIGSIIIK